MPFTEPTTLSRGLVDTMFSVKIDGLTDLMLCRHGWIGRWAFVNFQHDDRFSLSVIGDLGVGLAKLAGSGLETHLFLLKLRTLLE